MASGSYQSNLLRFLVSQYWQGLSRHRQAIREARVVAELGGQVTKVAVRRPLMWVVRGSQRQFKRLQQSASKVRLSIARSAVSHLFDFSEFRRLPATADPLAANPFERAAMIAEVTMANSLLAVSEQLSESQREGLLESTCTESAPRRWLHSLNSTCGRILRQFLGTALDGEKTSLNRALTVRNKQRAEKITGLASDIGTRSLVLVRSHRFVWDGLSAEQQHRLQQEIEQWLSSHEVLLDRLADLPGNSAHKLPRTESMDLSVSSGRSIWTEALPAVWMVVLQMVNWLWNGKFQSIFSSDRWFQLADGRLNEDALEQPILRVSRATPLVGKQTTSIVLCRYQEKGAERKNPADFQFIVDVPAVTIAYVEHPLEKILNWIDRCLLWLEEYWQKLILWLQLPV